MKLVLDTSVLIAADALPADSEVAAYANEAGVYTRNGAAFAGVEPLVPVVTP